jgi:UDPglucose 6-dehydrogenase
MIIESPTFGILGYGYVGRATHFGLLNNQSTTVHDPILNTSKLNLKNLKYIFICIPTSTYDDIEILIKEIQFLIEQTPEVQIIIRSTLPVGTCTKIENKLGIKVFYIPEFLRERYWEEDCLKRPLIVGHNDLTLPDWLLAEQIHQCSTNEAEMVKMFSNNIAVMKIAFANLFYDLSQQVGADYDQIKKMYFQIAHTQTYMEVPGHDGTRGFGGKCLPKDFDFIIDSLDSHNIDNDWFKNIRDLNKEWQKKF